VAVGEHTPTRLPHLRDRALQQLLQLIKSGIPVWSASANHPRLRTILKHSFGFLKFLPRPKHPALYRAIQSLRRRIMLIEFSELISPGL
jgi:hypothetical protein